MAHMAWNLLFLVGVISAVCIAEEHQDKEALLTLSRTQDSLYGLQDSHGAAPHPNSEESNEASSRRQLMKKAAKKKAALNNKTNSKKVNSKAASRTPRATPSPSGSPAMTPTSTASPTVPPGHRYWRMEVDRARNMGNPIILAEAHFNDANGFVNGAITTPTYCYCPIAQPYGCSLLNDNNFGFGAYNQFSSGGVTIIYSFDAPKDIRSVTFGQFSPKEYYYQFYLPNIVTVSASDDESTWVHIYTGSAMTHEWTPGNGAYTSTW